MSGATVCPVCGGVLVTGLAPWHLTCPSCDYEGSILEPHISDGGSEVELDEASRRCALQSLRRGNFRRIADELCTLFSGHAEVARPRLLDVGCAHGWFLDACNASFDVTGIEPDSAIAESAFRRTGSVRHGFFPDVLQKCEQFDVIVFNDVLEHIPQVVPALQACYIHLSKRGMLVINSPSRTGAIYRFTKLMAKIGRPALFGRMWQKGFPSPHVHYFDAHSISALASAVGFDMVRCSRLPSVSGRGLYSRVRYSQEAGALNAAFVAAAAWLAIPLLRLLPADIEVWYLRKRDEPYGLSVAP